MVVAVIGTAALWLTFVWLGSAIVSSLFSDAKGYGEKLGLVTGTVLSVLGAFAWAVIPPREISRWKLHGGLGGLSGAARTTLIVVELVLLAAAAYAISQADASTGGRIGLIAVAIMLLAIAAGLVYTVDLMRATGGKTMAELRAERQVIE
jgi:hypothetical protein